MPIDSGQFGRVQRNGKLKRRIRARENRTRVTKGNHALTRAEQTRKRMEAHTQTQKQKKTEVKAEIGNQCFSGK